MESVRLLCSGTRTEDISAENGYIETLLVFPHSIDPIVHEYGEVLHNVRPVENPIRLGAIQSMRLPDPSNLKHPWPEGHLICFWRPA